MEFYDFPYIGNVIIPTESYFSEGYFGPAWDLGTYKS